MDLGEWLRSLGLEQCEAAFRDALGARAEATRPSANAAPPGPPVDAAERRQVTR